MNEYEPSLFSSFAEQFQEGGWTMYPIALSGCGLLLLGLVFLVVAVLSKTNRALPLAFGLLVGCVLPPALGVVGEQLGKRQMEAAIVHADPQDQELIRMAGSGEALANVIWGFGAAAVPLFFGGLLLGIGVSRLDRFRENSA